MLSALTILIELLSKPVILPLYMEVLNGKNNGKEKQKKHLLILKS